MPPFECAASRRPCERAPALWRIIVAGYADGEEQHRGVADRVSADRAQAVAAFLRLNGIPVELIGVRSYGATRHLVRASGAEPQNRRVELVMR